MVVAVNTFPDLEAVARYALAQANISEIGSRWYSSIPAKNPQWPLGTVIRIGGLPPVRQYLDMASLQIDVWGESKSQARDIAAQARTVLFSLEGTSVSTPVSAFISGVDDSLGLTWQPDPVTGRDRYLFGVLIYGRASEGSSTGGGFGTGGFGE